MGSAKTTFTFSTTAPQDTKADAVIVPVFQAAKKDSKKKSQKSDNGFKLPADLKELNKALQGIIEKAANDEKFSGAKGSLLVFRKTPADSVSASRIILVGLGKEKKLKSRDIESAYLKAVKNAAKVKNPDHIAIALPGSKSPDADAVIKNVVDTVYQSTYRSDEATSKGPQIKKVTLLLHGPANKTQKNALKEAKCLAHGRSLVKDLVNKPANIKRTKTLADVAKNIAKSKNVTFKVQSDAKWLEKNMPCMFEVARGSVKADPPRYITLHYKPTGKKKPKKRIALIGKSVIFDTGGYQVKPGSYMNTMKGDMTGGATVLGVFQALSELKPDNIEVLGYLAATPNMIDAQAMIPDSIVNTTCGKKVEIRHTDAEGRLTLIDVVAQAVKDKPDEMVTVATLTGAASSAVGLSIALMSREDDTSVRDNILKAAKYLGEPIQDLDIEEKDFEDIKSSLDGADIRNTNKSKKRGAQCAGAFVMSGAPDDMPFAHLDIAGADMAPDDTATGIGAKALIQYLINEN